MRNYTLLIFLLSTLLLSQIIEIDDCTYSDSKLIPHLGGNLKPEVQPSWNNADYVNLLNELETQMMRWPGAEASNFFDWNKGTTLPCYKWDKGPCFPSDCPQLNDDSVNYCSENDNYSICDTLSAREWHYNNDLVLTNYEDEVCKKVANYTNNFSSHYLDVITNRLDNNLNPLFVINMLNPSYYDVEEAIFDDECNITNEESLKNTIDIQLDSIALAVTDYGIAPEHIYIQLSNEPFMPNHEWIRKTWPTVEDYAQDAIMCAYKIREHSILSEAKIGLGGDVHSNGGCDECTEDPLRCNWNDNLWNYIHNQGESDLFDAITFHKYSGLFNMKIPNFDETNCDVLEGWQNIDIYDSLQFGKFGVSPYTLRDNCIMNYFMKWNVANVQYTMNNWDGGPCWNDDNQAGTNLYEELTGFNNNLDIWMTEYDFGLSGKPYLYDNDPNAGKPYQGTWSHTLHSLYETISYMMKIPNIKILILNNINGFSGNYRLIDTYAHVDEVLGTNACKFHNEDGISSCFEKCSNEFIGLSPKGEAARLLNQLSWRNEEISEINFNNQVNSTLIKRYNTEISWSIHDIYGWKFEPEGDYLLINFSENQYEINLENNTIYEYSIITTDSLFKKNYFHLNPSIDYCADASESYPNCTIDYDGYYQWEFTDYSNVPFPLDEYFSHSSNLIFSHGGLADWDVPTLILPKHSIIQIQKLGSSNDGYGDINLDGNVDILDIVELVSYILGNIDLDDIQLADLNEDSIINIQDVIILINVILNN